jgi:RNA polymerase sigma-70 factor (ECF subfamily)
VAADLVERAQRGDHDAFEVLARSSIDRLYAIASRVLRNPAAAEDAVQECLVRAWRDLRALRDPARFEAWLYRLLLNACRDEQRRSRRRPVEVSFPAIDPIDGGDGPADVVRRDELERGFRRLTLEHRLALTLHHYLGLPVREVAALLGIPEGTATSRIHYAGRALRAALDPDLALAPAERGAAE